MKWEQTFVAYSDCGQYKIEVEYERRRLGSIRTGNFDYWTVPAETKHDELSCPVLESNIENAIKPTRVCCYAAKPTLAGRVSVALELLAANQISVDDANKILFPDREESGYDQILAQIKRESSEVKL